MSSGSTTTVFLSSTSADLAEYRAAVIAALEMPAIHTVAMESFTASEQDVDTYCGNAIRACDLFIGIVGHRYGSIHPPSGQSYTEREYDVATSKSIPRLMFLAPDTLPIAETFHEAAEMRAKQRAFRSRVTPDVITTFSWHNPDQLAREVLRAVLSWTVTGASASSAEVLGAYGRAVAISLEHWPGLMGIGGQPIPLHQIYSSPAFIPVRERFGGPDEPTVAAGAGSARTAAPMDQDGSGAAHRGVPPSGQSLGTADVLRGESHVALLGPAGVGKTMAARFLAWVIAADQTERYLSVSDDLVPVYLAADAIRHRDSDYPTVLDAALKLASTNLGNRAGQPGLIGALRDAWNEGRMILIIDAFDEYRSSQAALAAEIQDLVLKTPIGSRVLVTSRRHAFAVNRPGALATFTLNELEVDDIPSFIRRMFSSLATSRGAEPEEARSAAATLVGQLGAQPQLMEIARRPLLLSMLVILTQKWGNAVIDLQNITTRAQLYQEYLNQLVIWEEQKPAGLPTSLGRPSLLQGMARLAFRVQEAHSVQDAHAAKRDILVQDLATSDVFEGVQGARLDVADRCVEFWLRLGLLEEHPVTREMEFKHMGFQAFGSALHLSTMDAGESAEVWNRHLYDVRWDEVRELRMGLR